MAHEQHNLGDDEAEELFCRNEDEFEKPTLLLPSRLETLQRVRVVLEG